MNSAADPRLDPADRLDLHNCEINEGVAKAGLCGNTHLETGRTCILPFHHDGSCHFVAHDEALEKARVGTDHRRE